MSNQTETAVLAGGCFWGMQDLIRRRPGVVSTRVGYTGGDVPNATYRNHGSHAEAIEIVFDPEQHLLPGSARVLLPDPRPDDEEPAGQRHRRQLPLGHLLHDDEQQQVAEDTIADVDASGLWPGQGRHRGRARRPVLGGRTRAPGLPRALPRRLHLPLRPARLEAPAPLPTRRPPNGTGGSAPSRLPTSHLRETSAPRRCPGRGRIHPRRRRHRRRARAQRKAGNLTKDEFDRVNRKADKVLEGKKKS